MALLNPELQALIGRQVHYPAREALGHASIRYFALAMHDDNPLYVDEAYAQAAGSPESSLMSFLPLILMFVVLYFLMIRPQMKRAKEHKAMIGALNKGDEVITAGGVVGKITDVSEAYVTVDIGSESPVTIHIQKQAVQTLLPKGTIKGI